MNPAPFDIWQSLASAGLPALLMGIAIWWLQGGNTKLITSQQESNAALVLALNTERSERLDAMEGHIVECDTDRKELRNMLLHHLGAVSQNKNPILP